MSPKVPFSSEPVHHLLSEDLSCEAKPSPPSLKSLIRLEGLQSLKICISKRINSWESSGASPRSGLPNRCLQGHAFTCCMRLTTTQGTEAKIKHANDIYEVASEASFKDARKRFFNLREEDLTFSETMLTFNHIPPVNQELLFQLKDGTWVTVDGNPSKSF